MEREWEEGLLPADYYPTTLKKSGEIVMENRKLLQNCSDVI